MTATLNESQRYGVSWFGRRKVAQKQVVENGTYRVKTKSTIRAREEQIPVPTPDPGIPRELVEAAREAIKHNVRSPSANRRFWELSGGLARCALCGGRMQPDSKPVGSHHIHYYRCARNRKNGTASCANYKSYPALEVERRVWELVSALLTDPDQLRDDLERMIEVEREGMRADPGREARAWLDKLSEVGRQRFRAQDMAIEGLLDYEELKTKLAALEEARETARCELARLEGQQEKVARLERDKDALLESYANRAPEALDAITPQERRHVYGMLKAKVFLYPDASK